jgi:uncharacterized protein (TIRG00374 family)
MTRSVPGGRRVSAILGLLVLLVLGYLAVGRLDLARVAAAAASMNVSWVLLAALSYAATLPLWALQWSILSPHGVRSGFRVMLGVVAMTSSVYCTAVTLVGEAAAIGLLIKRAGLAASTAVSLIAMDQLLVGLAKLTVVAAAALLGPLPGWMRAAVIILLTGVSLLGATALLMARSVATWQILARSPTRLAFLDGLTSALTRFRSPSIIGGGYLLALGKKVMELVAILSIQQAFGIEPSLGLGLLALAAVGLATMIPIIPGNIGIFEGALILVYSNAGVPAEQAAAMAVVQHACYLVALALPGYRWMMRAALAPAEVSGD